MSYTIAYGRVFLRSNKGITPCVLLGDSSVWDPARNRRPRDWSILNGFLGTSEREIKAWLDETVKGPDREFLYNPKRGGFMHNDGFRRWVENGIKKAVSLEEFLEANRRTSVTCQLWKYGEGCAMISSNRKECETSQALDEWIESVLPLEKGWFPLIKLPEEFVLPAPWPENEPFLLKTRNYYVQDVEYGKDGNIRQVSYSHNVLEAKVFEPGARLNGLDRFKGCHKKISVSRQAKPNNIVLRMTDGPYPGLYVGHRSGRRMRIEHAENAQRFEDEKAAPKAMASIEKRYKIHCEPVVLLGTPA